MKRLTVLLLAASLAAAALLGPSAFAQASATPRSAAPAAPGPTPNLRFFQSFITEAGIADRQWYGIDYTYDNGAVPPIQGANGWALTPTVAISFFKNLEVGGRISWLDYTLNNDVVRYPGDDFSGASGFGDLTLWGKYRFINGPVAVTAGTYFVLPTASNDDGLGTGQVNWALFGAARVKTGPGYFDGSITVQFNHDATVMGQPLNGKTSFTLAANYMWQMNKAWAFSGEITASSEPFAGASSDFLLTGGVHFLGLERSRFRGAIGLGLTDGAPNFELILGYAFTF